MRKRPASVQCDGTSQRRRTQTQEDSQISESTTRVAQWLKDNGFSNAMCQRFVEQRIDEEILKTLTDDDLKDACGIRALGDRRRLLRLIDEYPSSTSSISASCLPVPAEAPHAFAPAPLQDVSGAEKALPTPKSSKPPRAQTASQTSSASDPPTCLPSKSFSPSSSCATSAIASRQSETRVEKSLPIQESNKLISAQIASQTLPACNPPACLPSEPCSPLDSCATTAKASRRRASAESTVDERFPGLPDGQASERQHLRCEVITPEAMRKDLGYGGAIDTGDPDVNEDARDREQAIKSRIRKMLDMAWHPNTSDSEREQALRNAKRMLRIHNMEEGDILKEKQRIQGGLFAVKLTAIKHKHRIDHDRWIMSLRKAISLTFDVAHFTKRTSKTMIIVFYGGSASAEVAVYAFACAANLIEWNAGGRALPKDKKFTFGEKHRGETFSSVYERDPGYVDWAVGIERSGAKAAGHCLQEFVEYCRARMRPADYDRSYKEGMADALLQKAKAAAEGPHEPGSDAIAISNKQLQEQVLGHFGITVHMSSVLPCSAYGFRNARGAGHSDAASVSLGQHQLTQGKLLALPC